MFSKLLWKDWQMKLMTQYCDSNCLVIKSYPQKSTWHEQTYARRRKHTQNMPHFLVITIAPDKSLYYCAEKSPSAAHNRSPTLHTISNSHAPAFQSFTAVLLAFQISILRSHLSAYGMASVTVLSVCPARFVRSMVSLWLLADTFLKPLCVLMCVLFQWFSTGGLWPKNEQLVSYDKVVESRVKTMLNELTTQ